MALSTYRSCTSREKRTVLRTFWSGRRDESARINRAAGEYAPYALGLIVTIAVETVVIATLLVARASGWAWSGTAAAVLAWWCAGWTEMCRRRINAVATAD
ncbi:MAG: hypothetical protein HIU57_05135 [Acidobacteria bacterium]|nr:hypothetical protein [Acidobacteriota bacterium]